MLLNTWSQVSWMKIVLPSAVEQYKKKTCKKLTLLKAVAKEIQIICKLI